MESVLKNELTLYLFYLTLQIVIVSVLLHFANKKYSNNKGYKIERYMGVCVYFFLTTPDSLLAGAFEVIKKYMHMFYHFLM